MRRYLRHLPGFKHLLRCALLEDLLAEARLEGAVEALDHEAEWLRKSAAKAQDKGYLSTQLQGYGWAAGWVQFHADCLANELEKR